MPIGEGSIKLTLQSQWHSAPAGQREGVPAGECCLFSLGPMGRPVGRISWRSASWHGPWLTRRNGKPMPRGESRRPSTGQIVLGVGRASIVGRHAASRFKPTALTARIP